jgi:CPA1 family monovalent cation:H+ antiporter
MIQENILVVLSLLFVIAMLVMLSNKLRISYPILLVLAGLLIGFIPGIPSIDLQPDLVFLIFLPPLLYAAAWNTSWKDFWKNKRPISLLAFGLVISTSAAVAYISHAMIPDFSLAMGFMLGAVISPPDAVAAASVLQGLKVPKRVLTILEGESLINDAASLIVFRFALAAILTGKFVMWKATGDFFLVVVMGIAVGLAIALIVYAVHRFLPTTPSIDTAITIISPYIMYIAAEHFHFSGVLAVVTGGVFLSVRSHVIFSYNTRIQAYSVWETIVFMLNGFVFILIGLQLPHIIAGLGQYSIADALLYGVIISGVTIIIRIIWVYPGAYVPRFLFKSIREKESRPSWQTVFVVGWSGMRGVVSLASALAIPLTLTTGEQFPHRSLILFITFIVILFTLVLQGLSLPWIIRLLKIKGDQENAAEQETEVRLRLAKASLEHMVNKYNDELGTVDAYIRLKERYERMIDIANKRLSTENNTIAAPAFLPTYRQMLLDIISVKRKELKDMHRDKSYPDELLRNKEWELDLEEARLMES